MMTPQLTVVIPTYHREQALQTCLKSFHDATHVVETILLRERGALAHLRNVGWRRARAPYVLFLDDDVVLAPGYLTRLLTILTTRDIVGCSGPAIIPPAFRAHRDLFRWPWLTGLYHRAFVAPESRPGHLSPAGTFVPFPDRSYGGPVQFLEACHMAFKRSALEAVQGFDEAYGGVGDWSEPDLCFRLRERFGPHSLWYDSCLCVDHCCSANGATALRAADASTRLANYRRFAQRWVRPTFRHRVYQTFLAGYYRWR